MLIGFIGTPSCGKSTTAFGLCYELKKQGYAVEFIAEYARRQIMQCRIDGIDGNGGAEGQALIYKNDSANALLYRHHGNAITIMDGSTVNCHFYGIDGLDLIAEAEKYDLLFYIPTAQVPPMVQDANRMQNQDEIMAMARRWEKEIRPLMAQAPHIVELIGYPHSTSQQMVDMALKHTIEKSGQILKKAS